ncbi:MAG: hypothetical protein ABI690_32960, partial [Chloroflexota bacterium]
QRLGRRDLDFAGASHAVIIERILFGNCHNEIFLLRASFIVTPSARKRRTDGQFLSYIMTQEYLFVFGGKRGTVR